MEVLQSERKYQRETWNIRERERTIEWVKIGGYVKNYSHLEFLKLKVFKDLKLCYPIPKSYIYGYQALEIYSE